MKLLSPERPRQDCHFDSLEQEVFLNLWRAYDRLRILEDQVFGEHALTPQQYNILRLLRSEYPEPVPTLALARRLVSRAPNITRMLDSLEKRGLIERQRPADNRRVVRVRVTAAGLALLRDLKESVRACHVRQLGHMSAKDLKKLIALLHAARKPHERAGSPWL
jgi:DNA-binding MarR family transcriptional regulator